MRVPALHDHAAANSGMFDIGTFTRNRGGACGSVVASVLSASSRSEPHQTRVAARKNCWSSL
jgi:hypothetical protein